MSDDESGDAVWFGWRPIGFRLRDTRGRVVMVAPIPSYWPWRYILRMWLHLKVARLIRRITR